MGWLNPSWSVLWKNGPFRKTFSTTASPPVRASWQERQRKERSSSTMPSSIGTYFMEEEPAAWAAPSESLCSSFSSSLWHIEQKPCPEAAVRRRNGPYPSMCTGWQVAQVTSPFQSSGRVGGRGAHGPPA